MSVRSPSASHGLGSYARAAESRANWAQLLPRRNIEFLRGVFALSAALTDALVIVLSAAASGLLYHLLLGYDARIVETFVHVSCLGAVLFLIPNFMQGQYSVSEYFSMRPHVKTMFKFWNMTFVILLSLGFLTKTMSIYSRSTTVIFYVLGLGALLAARQLIVNLVRVSARGGELAASRLFLVGYEEEIRRFAERYPLGSQEPGLNVLAACVLRPGANFLEDDLALAAASARMVRPDDVFVLVPWTQKEIIDTCVAAFLRVPAAIHLAPERVLEGFGEANVARIGPIASINVVRRPLSIFDVVAKRAMDVVLASLGLVLLAPVFLIVAAMIKLDSKGPVFFLQRRYGFNQEPFRIVKFRSMITMEDDSRVQQAAAGDERITRVGRLMRRFNIDELPQLFNVLRGDMSLVGPRPHALAHDQQFERTIALYARRHNVRPGITGWAQVNGLRGEVSSQDKIAKRVEHDLYYIDNWSLLLDIVILALTVFSPKAYHNAN
ncbi:MAG TPA: exopolysaccharide biosynthesis polyprenyl glycosylphosphotransferase [Beijerinckiaceae bacterium]|nr:exopolysaccharide biosynthesis polyprenyl glycosylphosphotransferase [Beijerinckiaceae bacterium]